MWLPFSLQVKAVPRPGAMGRQLTQAGPIPPALSELTGALDTLWEATMIKLSSKADCRARKQICYVHNDQLITGLKV